MSQFFTAAVLTATVASGIQLATPFLLAGLGETMGQRSGVVNLGVDGIMLLGAFGAYYVAAKTGNLVLATGVGLGIGLVMGLVTAFVSVTLTSAVTRPITMPMAIPSAAASSRLPVLRAT